MQAIILAAGQGTRLGDVTSDIPKAMVRVAGRELILRVLNFVHDERIDDVTVVTGYMHERLASFLRGTRPDVRIIHNPEFKAGNILTMKAALPLIGGEFIMLNVDHIYPRRMLGRILEQKKGISAVCDFDRRLVADDMKVKLKEDRTLHRISKTLDDFDGGYIGMTMCAEESVDTYKAALKSHLETAGAGSCVEHVLGSMASGGTPVNICDASGIGWLEVDTKEDLAGAEAALRRDGDNSI
jgi:CDP-L-myo-inositol myo-inositolphosphotransferase